jgi:hypothetical protein
MTQSLRGIVLFIGLAAAFSGCGAAQTKAHEPAGAGGLQPTQEDGCRACWNQPGVHPQRLPRDRG